MADPVRTSKRARSVTAARPSLARRRPLPWVRLSDEELLDLKLCDLGLSLEGSWIEPRIEQLYRELGRQNLRLRPACWLSDEWFAPTSVPGIAIPFYLVHPRLRRLELRQMGEVEGGTKTWCMQLLRHEAGHAFETAYRLHRRRCWREAFGWASQPYPEAYSPDPSSRDFVLHLDWWYAQSHPTEDFAETFAVWLTPGSQWRRRYREWPALRKLECVDELMTSVTGQVPSVRSGRRVAPLRLLRKTLREHYEERRNRYDVGYRACYDLGLERLFASSLRDSTMPAAASFLRVRAPELCQLAGAETPEHGYAARIVLKDLITRCRELDLRVSRSTEALKHEVAALVASHAEDYLKSRDLHVTV